MRINHNIASLNTYRQLTGNTTATSKSLEKLSSGLRINRAGDDAAGLAISEKMRGQIRGLDQAASNAQDGISMIQTAEGALNETHSILQRMRELAVQSATDTNTASDRAEIQKEVDQLATELTRIANDTEFNTQKLLNGGVTAAGLGESTFHIGANANQSLNISINAMDAESLGVARDISTSSATGAGSVSSATIGASTGAGIIDAEVITLSYTAADPGTATSGAIAGSGAAAATVGTGGTLNLTIDGEVVDVTIANSATAATIVTSINTAANTALGTTGQTYAALNAGVLNITSLTTGTSSSVAVVGASGTILTDLNLAVGTDTGDAAVPTSAYVTLTGSTAGTQNVDVLATDTSFTVSASGAFQGLTVNLSAAASTITGTGNTITIASTTSIATAATFTPGVEKTGDAFTAAGIDVSTKSAANTAITSIESAVTKVSAERSKLGAVQNRLEHTINNLSTSSENLTASESRIRDVDMAKEMMAYTKNNILTQAATAMLAQANQQPQGVLQLLQ